MSVTKQNKSFLNLNLPLHFCCPKVKTLMDMAVMGIKPHKTSSQNHKNDVLSCSFFLLKTSFTLIGNS